MNPIIAIASACAIVLVFTNISDIEKSKAKYDCIAKVSTSLGADKAKELCK